ncbi:MAG TPA: hypothetical protein VFK43_11645 [Acidimicrobiales bacterium]|nr:hypothetical protein [Acidimicrobiales bacterium]
MGVVAAGVAVVDDDRPGRAVVSASGDRSGIDVTSTVTVTLPVEASTPPTTTATTTTLSKAAVDVLNAIAGSTTTTRRPATTTTTRPPAATTTVPTPTTAPPTTTTLPAPFRATLVNEHPRAVVLTVNRGLPFSLAPGQTIADVELAFKGGDLVQVWLAEDTKCGVSDSGEIFKSGGRYRVSIVVGPTPCNDVAIPLLRIVPL